MRSSSSSAHWAGRTEPSGLCGWSAGWGSPPSKFSRWSRRLGTPNEHNASHPPRLLAGGLGEGRHRRLPRPLSLGRLSAAGLHDARRRRRGRQPLQRLPRAQGGRQAGSPRRQALHRRARASSSPCGLMSTGTSMSPTSTSAGPSSTCAASSTATAGSSSTGRSARRMTEAEVETIIQRAASSFPARGPGSSRTTARSSSPGTSRSSSASAA